MSVSDTTMATSTVAASPGPKARSRPPRATSSAPVPAATISPAASTIGADRRSSRARPAAVGALGQPVAHSGEEEHAVSRW